MKFSLIMATLGRTREIDRFMISLGAQSHRDFELILVDQNRDARVSALLKSHRPQFPVLHLRSERGVSQARNIGIEHVTGDVLGFPDDDCWYPSHLLKKVEQLLCAHGEAKGITGRVIDERGTFDARFDSSPGFLNRSNAWQRTAAVCLFLRSDVIDPIGRFDETLGPNSGTIWGGGEDIDYCLQALGAGFKIYYDPTLVVFHPNPLEDGYQSVVGRAYGYGAGIGRVWRKHEYPVWLVAYHLLRPTGGALLSLITGRLDKARYHWNALQGRLRGWLSKQDNRG